MQARHSWVFTMVDQDPDSNDYQLSHVFQGLDKGSAMQKMKEAKGWLQSLPLFKRPLVKTSAQVESYITTLLFMSHGWSANTSYLLHTV